ncbi:sensor histidine kinase [Hyphomonas neptunium ATCC 15444]|uniref:Sensor histidine kinase n=2 Tax=Hyphomonas TaxID=85 RepID=Q0C206_HYPNA|nr:MULTISPECIES: ATP-binding protein [Hyphomonas]ABI75495.1 sensor histidine kinase [Hyphomonas neptunium ATCC 15444]KCZ93047.1 sensor histidine kinase [Hyphomonas hirschiana VP5]
MQSETVSALRDLYRASEARAARLTLLFEAGRDLAFADAASLSATLSQCARRAALFAGAAEGQVIFADGEGIPLIAPGPAARRVGTLIIEDWENRKRFSDEEDRGALDLLAGLMATAIDRIDRVREREDLLGKLKERERQLEHLVGRIFTSQEDERRRVAHDLHDGVAQTAAALFRRLDALTERSSGSEAAALAPIARSLVGELRGVIAGLRPTALDDLGISAAISSMADGLREDGYEVTFRQAGPDRWPPVIETAFFRIVQEALTNIRKHAGGPCQVDIVLSAEPDSARWHLSVRDGGKGLASEKNRDVSKKGQKIGLEIMRERMMALGGELQVGAGRDGGTEVRACLERVPE